MSVVGAVIADRLAGLGCEVEQQEDAGRSRLVGLVGWSLVAIDTSSVSRAVEVLKIELASSTNGDFSAVAIRYKLGLRVLVLHEELRQAARVIDGRLPGSPTSAAASRVLARAEGWTKTVRCGMRTCCVMPLDDWLLLAHAWRMSMLPRRETAPMPQAEGQRIGRWIAHDYDAVRHAQVEAETTEQLRRGGKPLWSSVMGFEAPVGGSSPDDSLGSPVVDGGRRRHGRGGKKS